MNYLISKSFIKNSFCISKGELFSLVYNIKDVTILKGMKTQQPYIRIDEHTLMINPRSLVADFQLPPSLQQNNAANISFMDKHLRTYHRYVYFYTILQQSFYVKYNEALYYVMTNQPIIQQPQNPQFAATTAPATLEPIVLKSLSYLNLYPKISKQNLQLMLFQIMIDQSYKVKIQAFHMKQILKVVKDKLKNFDEIITEQTFKVKKKANRRVNMMAAGLLAQVGIINYLVYFHFSWDIMQPITCIIVNLNVTFALLYFLKNKQELSFQNILANSIETKKGKYLKEKGLHPQKYNELKLIKEYLEFRLNLMSKNQAYVMSQLDENLLRLDTD